MSQEPIKPASFGAIDPYDIVPYESRAVPLTHPAELARRAFLRGLRPAPPDRCRVLELGAADASNLVPMAFHLPSSDFVGVERSARQVEEGRRAIQALGLSNLTLMHADILALGDDLGTFDYIIAHGVFSWVSDEARERIWQICERHLAPHGVVYLSYNALPGWALRGRLRALLIEHTRRAPEIDEKIRLARGMLDLLARSALEADEPVARLLADEIALAQKKSDAYLLHEFLSPDNRAFDFREMALRARASGLAFLDEISSAMSPASSEASWRHRLMDALGDPLEAEQSLDFLTYRQFRSSLFCRAERLPAPRPSPAEVLSRAVFAGALRPEAQRAALEPNVEVMFVSPDGLRVAVQRSLLKAALIELGRVYPAGLSIREMMKRALALLELLGVPLDAEGAHGELDRTAEDVLQLWETGGLEMRLYEPPMAGGNIGPTPCASRLTRFEAEHRRHLTTPLHRVVAFDDFARLLVGALDGERDIDDLVTLFEDAAARGEIVIRFAADAPTDEEGRREALRALVGECVSRLAGHGLLT